MRECASNARGPTGSRLSIVRSRRVGRRLTAASLISAQQAAIHYLYDRLNRLVGVVDQEGNAASYTWDATGNLLRVERFDVAAISGPVGITLVRPSAGRPGTDVQIFGKGFSVTPADNSVAFNGVVTAAKPIARTTTLPPGATTGPITVTTPLSSATSPTFTVNP